MSRDSRMFREAGEAPSVVRAQLRANEARVRRIGALLRDLAPRAVVTCARGSSDHAATFAKYLIESRTKALASSAAPSLSSLYEAKPDLREVVFIAISQSGRSPDLVSAAETAKSCGACLIVLCNDERSPLAALADHLIPLLAGPETSVAATKSYIASLSAVVQLVACWTEDRELETALGQAPSLLERAWALDWGAAIEELRQARNLYVIGRGFGLGAAQEAALKLKETCGLHAEAFSAAEVRHGPMALIEAGFPVLIFAQADETREGVAELADELVRRGARVLLAGAAASGVVQLPAIDAHPVLQPMTLIQSFYGMAALLAAARNLDPDSPPHLAKVTETL